MDKKMETKDLKIKLIQAGLNNTQFAKLTGLNPKSITNWNKSNPPEWAFVLLDLYIKAKKYDELVIKKSLES